MYQILQAKELTTNIFMMVVEAKRVAKSCEPGQFVIVRRDADSERIPLTICDYDREAGTITIVFQIVGAGTLEMSTLKAGDAFHDVVGPLGRPSELVEEDMETLSRKKILFVAGGVGTAPVYPQVKWLHEHGIAADVIVGAKTKDLLILEEEMKSAFDTEKRAELATQMTQTILDDNAFIFASHLKMSIVSGEGVTGLEAHPCDYYEITVNLDKN